jgi:hypothetical protein
MTKSKGILIKDPIKRFWKFVDKRSTDECWEWTGRKSYKGYGRMKIACKHIQAHRFSYELFIGKIPKGICVCHTCDNPPCVNPNHLFLGTNLDNVHDRDRKGRKALGENNGKSKLKLEEVINIKAYLLLGYSVASIARMFGFPHSTINAIKLGRSWKWV